MTAIQADVIIIGSGPAGVSAAQPLIDANLSVVMLDAAQRPVPDSPQADLSALRRSGTGWRHAYGDGLSGMAAARDQSPKFGTRIGQAVLAMDDHHPPLHATGFQPVRSFNAGGLSRVWGAFLTAYDDADLRDYPIQRRDLEASYYAVAARIGLSGGQDDLTGFHGSGMPLAPPTWLMPIAERLLKRYHQRKPLEGFLLGTARNAVLTAAMADRQGCVKCGLCLYGCARGAIYDASFDLAKLQQRPNFRYIDKALVTRLPAPGDPDLSVEIAGNGGSFARARAVVVAAGTLNTTALALARWAAGSEKRRLLTNPMAALAFLIPSRIGRSLPSTGFSLAQLSYRLALDDGDYATGALYTVDGLPLAQFADRLKLSRPTALRLSALMAPALVVANFFLPGRYSHNTVSLQTEANGRERLAIEGQLPGQTRELIGQGTGRLVRALRRLGAFAVPGSLAIALPGADAHLVGTLPMREKGGALTCSRDGELRPWHNLFVVDGACLSDLPAKNCSLTIMANADRIGRRLATLLLGRGVHPPSQASENRR